MFSHRTHHVDEDFIKQQLLVTLLFSSVRTVPKHIRSHRISCEPAPEGGYSFVIGTYALEIKGDITFFFFATEESTFNRRDRKLRFVRVRTYYAASHA